MIRIPSILEEFGCDKLWLTADLHLGDPRQVLLGRPFEDAKECSDALIDNWNALVYEKDLVVVVGDWCMDIANLRWFASCFSGKKILLRGNYDKLDDEDYLSNGFAAVIPEGEGMLTTLVNDDGQKLNTHIVHYPSLCSPDYFNICGHIHGAWKVQKNMLNVGVDANHFLPIDVQKVFFYFNAISRFYDQDVWVAGHPANVVHSTRGKEGTYFESKFTGTLNVPT